MTAEEEVAQPSNLEVVPAKADVEAEGPQVVQVPPAMPRPATSPPADETLGDVEMMEFEKLVSLSSARLFFLNF